MNTSSLLQAEKAEQDRCLYSHKCMEELAVKKDGTNHSMCEKHKQYQARKLRERRAKQTPRSFGPLQCQYPGGCTKQRTIKLDGDLHWLCESHRERQNSLARARYRRTVTSKDDDSIDRAGMSSPENNMHLRLAESPREPPVADADKAQEISLAGVVQGPDFDARGIHAPEIAADGSRKSVNSGKLKKKIQKPTYVRKVARGSDMAGESSGTRQPEDMNRDAEHMGGASAFVPKRARGSGVDALNKRRRLDNVQNLPSRKEVSEHAQAVHGNTQSGSEHQTSSTVIPQLNLLPPTIYMLVPVVVGGSQHQQTISASDIPTPSASIPASQRDHIQIPDGEYLQTLQRMAQDTRFMSICAEIWKMNQATSG